MNSNEQEEIVLAPEDELQQLRSMKDSFAEDQEDYAKFMVATGGMPALAILGMILAFIYGETTTLLGGAIFIVISSFILYRLIKFGMDREKAMKSVDERIKQLEEELG